MMHLKMSYWGIWHACREVVKLHEAVDWWNWHCHGCVSCGLLSIVIHYCVCRDAACLYCDSFALTAKWFNISCSNVLYFLSHCASCCTVGHFVALMTFCMIVFYIICSSASFRCHCCLAPQIWQQPSPLQAEHTQEQDVKKEIQEKNLLTVRKPFVGRTHSLPNDSYMFQPVNPAPLEGLQGSENDHKTQSGMSYLWV